MLHFKCIGFVTLVVLLLLSCSSVRQIRPLSKKDNSITLSLGGPITELGDIYLPLPLLSIGYNRGLITNKLDLETGLHITQGLYGVMMIDAGINYRPVLPKNARPGLIVTPKLFFATNFNKVKFYPDLSLTGYWKFKENIYFYLGMENWFELSKNRYDGNKQRNHWLITPFLGLNLGNEKLLFQIETKIYTPNLKNTYRPVNNIGFGDNGILGIFMGLNYTL